MMFFVHRCPRCSAIICSRVPWREVIGKAWAAVVRWLRRRMRLA